MLGDNAIFTTTQEKSDHYDLGKIDETFLKNRVDDFTRHFYICGPDKMISDINELLICLVQNQTRSFLKNKFLGLVISGTSTKLSRFGVALLY
ncbi:hypothetical protein GCM10023229_09610 [Flavisolibacter ginsenosidimutans]